MKYSRRDFIRNSALAFAAMSMPGIAFSQDKTKVAGGASELFIGKSNSARKATLAALETFGGLKKVISKGDVVVIKPNIAWDKPIEQAANTNPEVVAVLCEKAFDAGAKTVKVFDNTINDPRKTYQVSGILEAARKAGAEVKIVEPRFFKKVAIPDGKLIKEWPIYTEVLDCDCLINVPVVKTHNHSKVTLAMKNSMGVIGGNRGFYHVDIGEKLADLATVVKPNLTVLDGYRLLTAFGPKGRSPRDAKMNGEVIISTDFVAIDAYGSTLLKFAPEQVSSVVAGHERGFGEMNLDAITIRRANA